MSKGMTLAELLSLDSDNVERIRGELSESRYWEAMERITRYSDNAAANELLEQ